LARKAQVETVPDAPEAVIGRSLEMPPIVNWVNWVNQVKKTPATNIFPPAASLHRHQGHTLRRVLRHLVVFSRRIRAAG